MEIKYLTRLRGNPKMDRGGSLPPAINRGLTMEQITTLETKYNSGNPFPVALRELLFLAGDYCYLLDTYPDIDEHNEYCPDYISRHGGTPTTNVFYIDMIQGDQFFYIKLDDGPDPKVYFYSTLWESYTTTGPITTFDIYLSSFINNRLERVSRNENFY